MKKKLDSGYTVDIKLTGPFAYDHITQRHPLPPAPVRKIKLAGGVVEDWPYNCPDSEPEEPEEKSLYNQFKMWERRCFDITRIRQRARAHYFMNEHITVVSGPGGKWLWKGVNFVKWICRMWGCTAPDNAAYLHFLKTQVIASNKDWEMIQKNAIAQEVTMEGLLDAADRFRDAVGRQQTGTGDQVVAKG